MKCGVTQSFHQPYDQSSLPYPFLTRPCTRHNSCISPRCERCAYHRSWPFQGRVSRAALKLDPTSQPNSSKQLTATAMPPVRPHNTTRRRTLVLLGAGALALWAFTLLCLGPMSSWTLAVSGVLRGLARAAHTAEKAAGAAGADDDGLVVGSLGVAASSADAASRTTAAMAHGMVTAGVVGAAGVLVLVLAALGVRWRGKGGMGPHSRAAAVSQAGYDGGQQAAHVVHGAEEPAGPTVLQHMGQNAVSPIHALSTRDEAPELIDLEPPLTESERRHMGGAQVCVTGGAGYVGSHIVRRLLAAGATVHVVVRDKGNTQSWAHLQCLPGAAEKLHIFQADLVAKPEALRSAVAGCTAVVHTAAVYALALPRGRERAAVVTPALAGTQAVLDAVAAEPSVTSVVLTSSVAAVWVSPSERGKGHVFTEADWCAVDGDEGAADGPLAYYYAKAAAERLAHKAWQAQGGVGCRWRLVVLLPGAVWGPPLSGRRDSESVAQMARLMRGHMPVGAPPLGTALVDVRDVAAAHTRALADQGLFGRVLLGGRPTYPLLAAAEVLRKSRPSLRLWLPWLPAPRGLCLALGPWLGLPTPITRALYGTRPVLDDTRARQALGLGQEQLLHLERTINDMAAALEMLGIA